MRPEPVLINILKPYHVLRKPLILCYPLQNKVLSLSNQKDSSPFNVHPSIKEFIFIKYFYLLFMVVKKDYKNPYKNALFHLKLNIFLDRQDPVFRLYNYLLVGYKVLRDAIELRFSK